VIDDPSMLRLTRKVVLMVRILPTLDLIIEEKTTRRWWKRPFIFTQCGTSLFIYYESTNRKIKTKYICGCRCYERLQSKTKEFTCLSYTELVLELEHLKIETRLITEMFPNVMDECEN
jgi:hypothetical protein